MTLRVYIDIVPFGIEDEAYPLYEININNIGGLSNGEHEYSFEVEDVGVSQETVTHARSEGAIELVRKVLNTDWIKENIKNE